MTASLLVESRLVGEHDRRRSHHRPGDRHALLLAAGELRRVVLHAVRHADALERLLHPLLALRRGHAAVGERQLDVLVHRQVADEVEGLEDEADLAVADARPVGHAQVGDRLRVERVAPLGRRVEETEQREQRRLAAARGPGDRHELPVLDLQVDPREGVGLDLVGVEDLGDSLEADERQFVGGHGRRLSSLRWRFSRDGRGRRRPRRTCR
jgi:hypothetical protein